MTFGDTTPTSENSTWRLAWHSAAAFNNFHLNIPFSLTHHSFNYFSIRGKEMAPYKYLLCMNRIGVVKCLTPRRAARNRVEWTRDALNHWIDDGHVTQKCRSLLLTRQIQKANVYFFLIIAILNLSI